MWILNPCGSYKLFERDVWTWWNLTQVSCSINFRILLLVLNAEWVWMCSGSSTITGKDALSYQSRRNCCKGSCGCNVRSIDRWCCELMPYIFPSSPSSLEEMFVWTWKRRRQGPHAKENGETSAHAVQVAPVTSSVGPGDQWAVAVCPRSPASEVDGEVDPARDDFLHNVSETDPERPFLARPDLPSLPPSPTSQPLLTQVILFDMDPHPSPKQTLPSTPNISPNSPHGLLCLLCSPIW